MHKSLMSTTIIASTLLSCASFPAFAADDAQLRAQVEALEAKIDRLEKLLHTMPAPVASSTTSPAATTITSTPAKQDASITMAPSPKFTSEDGNFTFNVGGFLQTDGAVFMDDLSDQPDGTTIRRARLAVSGTFLKDWGFKLENDFADNSSRIADAFITYGGLKPVNFTVGQFKEPFSLEELTSDRYVTFLERAAPNVFAPSRNIGFQVDTHGKNWSLAGGVFGDNSGVASTNDEAASATARATFAPLYEKTKSIHLGIAGSMRKPDSTTNTSRFSVRPESRIAKLVADTGTIRNVDTTYLVGMEAATVWNAFSLQGEYITDSVNRNNAGDVQLNGGYIQASWFLTGESRSYNPEKGIFERVTPAHPFSLKDGGKGAWEIAARYSTIDMTDSSVRGGKMDNYAVGLNWYANKYIRLMTDYIYSDTDRNSVAPNDNPQIITARFQVDF